MVGDNGSGADHKEVSMDWNHTKPEGAFCVVSGTGARFYGDTRQEAHDAMMADAAATAKALAKFGKGYLNADVVAALPALPIGYEYLVLERSYSSWNGDYETPATNVPYEWRTFAVRHAPEDTVDGNAAVVWRSGQPYDREEAYGRVTGTIGRGPVILRHRDGFFVSDGISLPPESIEFADGAWVPRTAIDLPYRGDEGVTPLAPPDGYGIVLVRDTGDDGLGDYRRFFALPFGEQTLFCDDFRHRKIVLATVTVTVEPSHVSKSECFREGNPTMPPGTMELRDGAWAAYDRDACDRRDAEERAKHPGGGWGSRPADEP